MVEFFDNDQEACFIEDFTSANGLWAQRISEWEKKCPKLAEARKRVNEITASRVASMGLRGKANPTFAIFALKQKGWRDTQEIKTDITSGGQPLAATQLSIYAPDKA
jgi:hypothetical protein